MGFWRSDILLEENIKLAEKCDKLTKENEQLRKIIKDFIEEPDFTLELLIEFLNEQI